MKTTCSIRDRYFCVTIFQVYLRSGIDFICRVLFSNWDEVSPCSIFQISSALEKYWARIYAPGILPVYIQGGVASNAVQFLMIINRTEVRSQRECVCKLKMRRGSYGYCFRDQSGKWCRHKSQEDWGTIAGLSGPCRLWMHDPRHTQYHCRLYLRGNISLRFFLPICDTR